MSPIRSAARVRVIVTTDPELDDLNSMLRLVLYSNEIEIAALTTSSSQFHSAGDAERGIEPHRWPPVDAPTHIDQALDAYAQVHHNLAAHDPRYPDPQHLRSLVRVGNIASEGDTADPSPGSELIASLLTDDEPGTIAAQAWGGFNTIARALMSIESEARAAGTWEQVRAYVSGRTVLTSFGQQDTTFAEYIRPTWPDLELRQVATLAWCYPARAVIPASAHDVLSAEWTRRHVSSVGPIGAAYRVWGDGLQMAEGFDAEDYFGLTGLDETELAALGYQVFIPPQPAGAWISEGDSSNVALHVQNGLRNWEHPTFGGWGGRQAVDPEDPHSWVSVGYAPFGPDLVPSDWGDVGRWVPAFQRDFAGRLRWSVTDDPSKANHHPRIEVISGLDPVAAAGDTVTVSWSTSDPDGDSVVVEAWIYEIEGSVPDVAGPVAGVDGSCQVLVPATAEPGDAIHVILEATDTGEPPLTAYARIVVTIAPSRSA